MNADITLTIGSVLLAVLLLAFLYITRVGILPLLASLKGLVDEKQTMARKGIESIDAHFAKDGGYVSSIVHEVVDGAELNATMPGVVLTASALTEAFKVFHKILPDVPGEVEPEVVARVGNQVFDFAAKLTDKIEGNLPDISVAPYTDELARVMGRMDLPTSKR